MGILSKLRGAVTEQTDPALEAYTNTAVQTRTTASDQETRKEKGIDIDMIDPEEVIKELRALAHYTITKPVLLGFDPENKPVIKDTVVHGSRPWAVAALVYIDKTWPTIWMKEFEADTMKLRIKAAFDDIRKTMPFEEKKRYGVILKAVENMCRARLEDTKDGHKALLLKVRREELGVHMTKSNQGAK